MWSCISGWIAWCVAQWDPAVSVEKHSEKMYEKYVRPREEKLGHLNLALNMAEQDYRHTKERIWKSLKLRGISDPTNVKLSHSDSALLNSKRVELQRVRNEKMNVETTLNTNKSMLGLSSSSASDYKEKQDFIKLLKLKERAGVDISKLHKLQDSIIEHTSKLTEQQQREQELTTEMQISTFAHNEQLQELVTENPGLVSDSMDTHFDFSEFVSDESPLLNIDSEPYELNSLRSANMI